MSFTTRLAAVAAAGAIALAGVASLTGIAGAQQPPTADATPTHRAAVRQSFLSHLASHLNVTMDQLNGAIKDAELATVDDLTADGTITDAQAAKMRERINNGGGAAFGAFFRGHAARERVLGFVRRGIVRSAAGAIGVAPTDLATELRGGRSIADVAGEHQVSLDTVKSAILGDAKTALDRARENGRIDQAKEDALLQRLTDNLDTILSKTRGQAPQPAQ